MKQINLLFANVRPILAVLIIIGAFAFLFLLLFKQIPITNQNLVALAAGYVLGMVSWVGGYYFNTSADSAGTMQQDLQSRNTLVQTPNQQEVVP